MEQESFSVDWWRFIRFIKSFQGKEATTMSGATTGNLVDVGGSSPPLAGECLDRPKLGYWCEQPVPYAATPGQTGDASLDLFKSTGQSDDENIFLEGQLTAPGPATTGSGKESILATNYLLILRLKGVYV